MTQEASQIEVSNLEDISDGKRIFTTKQWLERFRQYTKSKYKIDIAEVIRGTDVTQNGWTEKKRNTRRFLMGYRTRSLKSNGTGRVQDRTGQNKDQRFDQIIQRILLSKQKQVPQPRRILLDQTVRNRNPGRLLAEIDRN